jgi:hypothetical protein
MSEYWLEIEIKTSNVEALNRKAKEHLGDPMDAILSYCQYSTITVFEGECDEELLGQIAEMLKSEGCPNLTFKVETDFSKSRGLLFEGLLLQEELDSNGNIFIPITFTEDDDIAPIDYDTLARKLLYLEQMRKYETIVGLQRA